MKFKLLFTVLFSAFFSFSQGIREVDAEFPGGYAEFMKYIQQNLEIPDDFNGSGRVQLRFVISETGEVKDVQLRRGIEGCDKCNEAAIKVIEKMPNWKPAYSPEKESNIETHYLIPIQFEKIEKK